MDVIFGRGGCSALKYCFSRAQNNDGADNLLIENKYLIPLFPPLLSRALQLCW